MAVQLNFERVFKAPFSPQPFPLRCLADRAITLSPVSFVKGVALLAVSLARVKGWCGYTVNQGVLPDSDRLQVLGVHASPIAAHMINNKAISNFAVSEKPRYPVSSPCFAPQVKSPVAVAVQRTLPNVTLSLLRPFLIKSFNLSHAASFMVSKATWCMGSRQHALV